MLNTFYIVGEIKHCVVQHCCFSDLPTVFDELQFVSLGSPAVLLLLFMLFFATVTARKAFEGGKDMLLITMHNALDALWHVKSGKK